MKKLLFLCLFLAAISILRSNENQFLLNSKDFESKLLKSTSLGYKLVSTEMAENEYLAMYKNGNDFITVRLIELKRFKDYKVNEKNYKDFSGLYKFQECNAVFFIMSGMSSLNIEVLKLNASLEITSTKLIGKTNLEKFTDEIGILNLAPSKNAKIIWADEIPNDLKLEGNLIEIRKDDAGTEGYKYAYFVKIQFSKELLNSIDKILKKFGAGIDLINTEKFTLICSSTDSYEQLTKFKTGEIVEFVYYRK